MTFSASFPAEDCGSLPALTNGSSSGEKTTYPNKKAFICDDGFILRGSMVRKCQSNGTWSGVETFCEGSKQTFFIKSESTFHKHEAAKSLTGAEILIWSHRKPKKV